MGLRFPEQIHGEYFFITTTFTDWAKLGKIENVYESLAESMNFYNNRYLSRTIAYVFMPSHIHFILHIDGKQLGNYMRDFKKFISQKSLRVVLNSKGSIWMPRYDRVIINSDITMRTKIEYIHYNPVKAGLVSEPYDWYWSSAKEYLIGEEGVIPVFKDW